MAKNPSGSTSARIGVNLQNRVNELARWNGISKSEAIRHLMRAGLLALQGKPVVRPLDLPYMTEAEYLVDLAEVDNA